MRVLFSSFPAYGHVHPMVPLAHALLDRGHEVLWATGAGMRERVEEAGIAAVAAGFAVEDPLRELMRRYPEASDLRPEERRTVMFPKLFGEVAAPKMLEELLPLVDDWRPDLLIHDSAELAGPIAGSIAGVPHVNHSFGALVPPELVAAAARESAHLWQPAELEPAPFGGCYDHLYLDIYPPSLQPAPMDHVPAVQLLRPVQFDAVRGEDVPTELWPNDERPFVYVTFGTVFNVHPVFQATVDAMRDLDVHVLVTVGPRGDPGAFGPLPGHIRVERYVPQTLVLEHCDLVVSHGGSGTFLGALTRGIPQLCLPQAADQFVNGASAERVGAGPSLAPHQADSGAIAAAVTKLVDDRSFRDAASSIADEIAAMPAPSEVAAILCGDGGAASSSPPRPR